MQGEVTLSRGTGSWGLVWACLAVCAAQAGVLEQEAGEDLAALVSGLGDRDFARREEATRELMAMGPGIADELARLAGEQSDQEVLHRIRHVLASITPPTQAALVVRARVGSGLSSGDIITHVNGWQIRGIEELRRVVYDSPGGTTVRALSAAGPRDVGAITNADLEEVIDYVSPQGATVARVLRLYAGGYSERALELMGTLPDTLSRRELPERLRARILFTAGQQAAAWALLSHDGEAVRNDSAGDPWSGPSELDLSGPGKAPFHLERLLFDKGEYVSRPADPDLRVQRVLVPAGRHVDALVRAAELWWRHYRASGEERERSLAAGNMLAVVAWMSSKLDLQSECCGLIAPRSVLLRHTWVRVQTDAWLAFFGGDAKGAADGFYEDARDLLLRAPAADGLDRTRNPRVAAMISFFMYQFPGDPRLNELLAAVNAPGHPALTSYLDWMLYATREGNEAVIRAHTAALLPTLDDEQVAPYARALALLEYVAPRPRDDVFAEARLRLGQSRSAEREVLMAELDVLRALSAGRTGEAAARLPDLGERAGAAALRSTAEFLLKPPAEAANHRALDRPLLAIPLGGADGEWLVLGRDRRLLHFQPGQNLVRALESPTTNWFPLPATFPWIGREEATGRAWAYCRRRLVEVTPGRGVLVRLNLKPEQIAAFDEHVAPFFSVVADAIPTVLAGEQGEFRRGEVRANGEYASDPNLPEIGWVETTPRDARVVHVAFRGGPHLLVDTGSGRAFTSAWIGARLGLPRPPRFFPEALFPEGDSSPVVMLLSEQGLLRFDVGEERVSRLALPGEEPHPAVVPEWAPYERRDPRYFYLARLPEQGGGVYRYEPADGVIEAVDLVNEALPASYYSVRSRVELRAEIDRRLVELGIPAMQEFIEDARQVTSQWKEGGEQP